MVQKTIVKIDKLTKKFDKKVVLKNISLNIYEEEILGILGFSGEGKSTLLNMIVGLEKPNSGEIKYYLSGNSDVESNILHDYIGYSTQEPSFYDEMSVLENLDYFGTLLKIEKKLLKKREKKLLEIFKLTTAKNTLGKDLSVGMKKRLDLACALIHNTKLLILDEPTANLDFKLREEFIKFIKKINSLGVTIIYVSHFTEEIEQISDRVLMLNNTKIKLGSTKNLKDNFTQFIASTN